MQYIGPISILYTIHCMMVASPSQAWPDPCEMRRVRTSTVTVFVLVDGAAWVGLIA